MLFFSCWWQAIAGGSHFSSADDFRNTHTHTHVLLIFLSWQLFEISHARNKSINHGTTNTRKNSFFNVSFCRFIVWSSVLPFYLFVKRLPSLFHWGCSLKNFRYILKSCWCGKARQAENFIASEMLSVNSHPHLHTHFAHSALFAECQIIV